MVTLSNVEDHSELSGEDNPLCAMLDEALSTARERFWLAVPWVYTRNNAPWLLSFIDHVAEAGAAGTWTYAHIYGRTVTMPMPPQHGSRQGYA